MWRIMHAAAAAAAVPRLFGVCIPVQLSAIFQLPCCFNTHSSPPFFFFSEAFCSELLVSAVGWKKWPRMLPDDFRSFASLTGPEVFGTLKVFGMWSLSATHAQHFKAQHWVCCLPGQSQDCSGKAPWDSLSAAKVSEASSWPKVNTPESVLAWLNMDEPLIGLWPGRPLVL